MTTAVVTDDRANRFGDLIQVPNQFLNGHRSNIRVIRYRIVQIIHIRRMVLVVMQMHRFGVNIRFKCFIAVGNAGSVNGCPALAGWVCPLDESGVRTPILASADIPASLIKSRRC